ncbi:hypothetical protein V6N13_107925 [Hibiscus sabdariffa]
MDSLEIPTGIGIVVHENTAQLTSAAPDIVDIAPTPMLDANESLVPLEGSAQLNDNFVHTTRDVVVTESSPTTLEDVIFTASSSAAPVDVLPAASSPAAPEGFIESSTQPYRISGLYIK